MLEGTSSTPFVHRELVDNSAPTKNPYELFSIKYRLEAIPNPNELEARTLRTINDEINTRVKDGIL